MTDPTRTGAAVIGTGFIGTVHIEALRRLGIPISGVLGSTPARGAERAAALGVDQAPMPRSTSCWPTRRLQVVHVTSPNVAHYRSGQGRSSPPGGM